jgi:glycosyltransferase involved in cell wall biosynthesis
VTKVWRRADKARGNASPTYNAAVLQGRWLMAYEPLVSIVSPVLNHADYVGESIESVQKQEYQNYEHIIVDNHSIERTGIIADHYARRDPRIRVVHNSQRLSMADNWNKAMSLISPDSVYCQILHGDDMLYPGCLSKKVAFAEANPNVGIIGSLRRRGGHIECKGVPKDQTVFPGRDIGRGYLQETLFAIAPSSGFLRSELVRSRQPFYPPEFLHTDIAAYLDILEGTDFGFIHEILNFSRVHHSSISSTVANRRRTFVRERLAFLNLYGPRYFTPAELAPLKQRQVMRCFKEILRNLARGDGAIARYHVEGLEMQGQLSGAYGAFLRFLSSLIPAAPA